MKVKQTLRVLAIIIVGVALSLVMTVPRVFAEGENRITFQDEIGVEFTFAPTLSIALDSNEVSTEVVPGNYSYSETPVVITVSTNNVLGYTLSAKVGGTGQTAANNNLVSTNENIDTVFTSVASDAALTLANFSPDYWGYTVAATVNSSTTFSGLSYNSDKVINATTNMSGTAATGYTGTSATNFRIGAKASDTQTAGEYTNVITFTVVGNVAVANDPGE